MPDYSLVPVDYQPDFDDYSLVPVDYDPFAADGLAQQAQFQQPPTPTQPQAHRRRNSQRREPVNPMPVRRLQAVAPADRTAAVSAPLEVPPNPTLDSRRSQSCSL